MEIKVHRKDPSSQKDSLRYELKLVCQDTAYPKVKMALRLNSSGLRPLFEPRLVQSIYFDTPQGKSLQDNLAGISARRKIRFRWYHNEIDEVNGHLEMKVRENTLGWKHTLKFAEKIKVAGEKRTDFTEQIQKILTPEWKVNLDRGMEPAQWICYLRDYFINSNGLVRVTVDRNLKSWDQRGQWRLSNKYPSPMRQIIIVEVKCAVDHYKEAEAVVAKLPLMVGKSSKFVMASSPGEGPLFSQLGRW
ncbi:MAG: VTC domain-containing protein [bacterium]|nr:VTC domain-containing protein [bacterium]